MEKNCRIDNLFLRRLVENNVFTEEERKIILDNKNLYEKCYYFGILDGYNVAK